MKIILNVDAITHPLTGIGRYTLELAQALQKMDSVTDLKLFSAGQWITQAQQAMAANQWLATARQYVPFKSLALRLYNHKRNRSFKQLSADLGDYIFHSPNFILMPFEGPSVVTIHDLSFIHHAESQPAYRIRFLQQQIPQTIEHASAIITPSVFIQRQLIEQYAVPENKVHVIPMGVSSQFYPRQKTVHDDVLNTLNLPEQFVLSVATKEPRKNLQRLIKAHAQLPQDIKQKYPLVLTGAKGWLDKSLNQDIQKAIRDGHIHVTGYVSEEQLATLYSAASVVALPSLYEGFGLPILEAMRSATAVLTSADSAMSEVADGRATLCDPKDVNSISKQLQHAIEHVSEDTDVLQQHAAYAQQFSWESCARKTLQIYQHIGFSQD